MVRKGLAVRYNVPMRYAGKPAMACAYLAGRRSGLRDLASRAFMDHALVRICDFAAQHVPAELLPAVPAMLGQVPGAPEFLAAAADEDARLAESTGVLGGICCVCGCTDREACPQGCAWADDTHTICTSCDPNVVYLSAARSVLEQLQPLKEGQLLRANRGAGVYVVHQPTEKSACRIPWLTAFASRKRHLLVPPSCTKSVPIVRNRRRRPAQKGKS